MRLIIHGRVRRHTWNARIRADCLIWNGGGTRLPETGAICSRIRKRRWSAIYALVLTPGGRSGKKASLPKWRKGLAASGTEVVQERTEARNAATPSHHRETRIPHNFSCSDLRNKNHADRAVPIFHEKHGVSQDSSKRYTKKEIGGGTVKVSDRGTRKEMLKKEREKVETNPGPKNKEPWAGKRKGD
jgi:hypothetical protein